MRQLLYTSCAAGRSLAGDEGFQVRGASAEIGSERMRAALPYMAYSLPAHIHPLQFSATSSPVRLAFLKTPELGPLLCHSVSAGVDPTTRRPGNFFSHLLIDVPPAFTAGAAIETWESDSWRRTDGPFEATLPDMEEIHAGRALNDEALGQFLSSEHGRKMFRFVLAAMITTKADWRVFLAAPSRDVALCVYGLTRVLPEGCQGTLTFSTYESQPLNCPARVVGTWAGDSAETDMPSSCYFGKSLGYNSCTGRASQLVLEGEFLDLAVTAATTGDLTGLDDLRAVCDRCGIDHSSLLNLVCRTELGGELSKEDVRRLASYPRFLSHLLSKPTIRRPLLDCFAEDQELTCVLATKVVPVLKENPEAIAAFRENAKQAAIEAVLHGEVGPTQALLEHVLPAASDAPTALAHMAVLTEIANPHAVPWRTRAYLLTQMARTPGNGQQAAIGARWLAASVSELPSVCGLSIPNGWKAHACLIALGENGVTGSLAETLTSHFDVLVEVLRHLPGNKEAASNLPSLVASLLAHSHAPARLVDDLVRHRRHLSSEVISAFLAAAARNGTVDVFSLASHSGSDLLEVLGGAGLSTFLVQLLDCPPERLLNNSQVLALFRAAVRHVVPGEIRDGLESVLAIRAFLDRPILSDEALERVAMALKRLRNPSCGKIGKSVSDAAIDAILAGEDSPSIGRAVESVLRNFGSFTSAGPGGLYCWLLERLRARKDFWKRQHLICAMVAIGLGAPGSTVVSRQSFVMAEQARDLVEEVAKRSKRRIFALIERQSCDWPDEARLRWSLFAKFVRPRRLIDRIARPWKKMAVVPLAILCLIIGAIRLSCRAGTVGTSFASGEAAVRQSHATSNPLVERIGHDRP